MITFTGEIPKHLHSKTIICSHSQYEKLRNHYKKRSVNAEMLAPDDRWFYFSEKGFMRTVMNGAIWVAIPNDCARIYKRKAWRSLK